MVLTIVCRDTINCKDTIVLCNGAVRFPEYYIALSAIPGGLPRAWQKMNIWNCPALVQKQVYAWIIASFFVMLVEAPQVWQTPCTFLKPNWSIGRLWKVLLSLLYCFYDFYLLELHVIWFWYAISIKSDIYNEMGHPCDPFISGSH